MQLRMVGIGMMAAVVVWEFGGSREQQQLNIMTDFGRIPNEKFKFN